MVLTVNIYRKTDAQEYIANNSNQSWKHFYSFSKVNLTKFVIKNENGENICSLHSIFKIKIFIPAVNLDGFATEHQTGLLRHFVLHKPSDVLFKLTAIERCSIVPSIVLYLKRFHNKSIFNRYPLAVKSLSLSIILIL